MSLSWAQTNFVGFVMSRLISLTFFVVMNYDFYAHASALSVIVCYFCFLSQIIHPLTLRISWLPEVVQWLILQEVGDSPSFNIL